MIQKVGFLSQEEIITTPPVEGKPIEEKPIEEKPAPSDETIGETGPTKERFVSFATKIRARSIKREVFTNVFLEIIRNALRK